MECSGIIRVGDVGTSLQFLVEDCLVDGTKVPLDLTNSSTIVVRFKRINDVEEDVTGSIYTGGENGDGTDGLVEYITPDGFITENDVIDDGSGKGWIKGIAIVTFDTSGPYHSSSGKFTVKSNF